MKGKILLAPFPYDNLSNYKFRPVLCLTDRIGQFNNVIIAYITSVIPKELLLSDLVINEPTVLNQMGLKAPSTIRLHRLSTVNVSIFLNEIGHLPEEKFQEVRLKLRQLLGL